MQSVFGRSSKENIATRLFLRFFLCYFAAILLGFCLFWHHAPSVTISGVGAVEAVFVALALVAAFLTVSNPYLSSLICCKAFYDAAALCTVFNGALQGAARFWYANAVLFYFVSTLLLFCAGASRACLFSFLSTGRDLTLLLSRRTLIYFLHALLILAACVLLYFIWQALVALA